MDADECRCHCHQNPEIKHVTPCCLECPYCRRNIQTEFYDGHVLKCAEDRDTKSQCLIWEQIPDEVRIQQRMLSAVTIQFSAVLQRRLWEKAEEGYKGWDGEYPEEKFIQEIIEDAKNLEEDPDNANKLIDIAARAMFIWNRRILSLLYKQMELEAKERGENELLDKSPGRKTE